MARAAKRVLSVLVADEKAFFTRGRRLAALADDELPMPDETTVSFGDAADMLKMLTPARVQLIDAVKTKSDSITALADRLHRDRSSVTRDVASLAERGLLLVKSCVLPGHGRMKMVTVPAHKMRLVAEL